MEYTKRAVKGAVMVLILSVFAALIGYFVRLILTRNITPEEYGMFYSAISLFGLFAIFKELGLNHALVKYVSEYRVKKQYGIIKGIMYIVFSLQFLTSIIVAILFWIFADYLAANYFHTEKAAIIIKILAVMFMVFPLENIFRYSFQGFQKMQLYALVEFMRMLAIVIFVSILFYMGFGYLAPPYAYTISYIVLPLIFSYFFIKMFPDFFKIKKRISKALAMKLIKFGLPVMLALVGAVVLQYTDTVIITYFRTLKEVGLYQVAVPTSNLLLYFTYALSAVVLPLSSELWAKGHKEKLQKGMELLYKYSFIVMIPAAMALFSYPELALKLLFGPEYVQASPVLQILSIGAIIYTIAFVNNNALSGIGHPKLNTQIILSAAIFNVISNIIFIPKYGIIGAALTTFASYLIILVLSSYHIRKFIKIKIPWAEWASSVLAGLIFVVVLAYLKKAIELNVFLEIIVNLAIAGTAYLAVLGLTKTITKKDIDLFKAVIRKKIT